MGIKKVWEEGLRGMRRKRNRERKREEESHTFEFCQFESSVGIGLSIVGMRHYNIYNFISSKSTAQKIQKKYKCYHIKEDVCDVPLQNMTFEDHIRPTQKVNKA